MRTRLLQRLFSLPKLRKSLTAKSSTDQKSSEPDRPQTDDLLLNDAALENSKIAVDVGTGVVSSDVVLKSDESTESKLKTRNYGQDVRKALASAFDIMSSSVSSHTTEPPQQARESKDDKISKDNTLVHSPTESRKPTDDIVLNIHETNQDTYQVRIPADKQEQIERLTAIIEGQKENKSQYESTHKQILLSANVESEDRIKTASTLFPPHEPARMPSPEKKPNKKSKDESPSDSKSSQIDTENPDHSAYQDYLNERSGVEASSGDHHTKYRDYIHERAATEDLEDIIKEKTTEVKPDVKSKIKQDIKADLKTDIKPDFKTDIKADFKADSKPDFKTDIKPDIQPEPDTNPTSEKHPINIKPTEYNFSSLNPDNIINKSSMVGSNLLPTSINAEKTKNSDSNILSAMSVQQPGKKIDLNPILGKPNTPDLYGPQTLYEPKKRSHNTIESIVNVKNNLEEHGHSIQKSYPSKSINPSQLPLSSLDALSTPSVIEPAISSYSQRDLLKYAEPSLVTSYDLVPGPSLFRAVGNIWKYVPILGTQCVSSFIYVLQSLIFYMDRNSEHPSINPYYYLINNYGPMVRLHGPLGADILVLAVNGYDYPIVHVKRKGANYQSLFDSLNIYRKEAPSLTSMLDIPTSWPQIPDNPTLTVDQHYTSLDRITEDFIKEKRFIYGCSGTTDSDSHENDLIRWALQCNLDVYFKSTKKCMVETQGNDSSNIVDCFIKASKYLRSSETGVQLWRAFTTFTWLELVDYCKQMDRYILDEVNECLTLVSKGIPSGSALERLLATGEILASDIFTSLLDLLLINVNIVASTSGFLLYNLGRTPQVQRTLFREISSVVRKGTTISRDDLSKLKYLNACITETLRMAPPFPVLKRLLEGETKIHRFQIPEGTYIHMVNILPYAKGDNSCDDIGKFQAERWTDKVTSLGGDPLAGLPQWNSFPKFNRELVMTQIALLVTKVVREYRIEYPQTEIYPNGKVLQGPSSPFNFTFIERQI